MEGESCFQFDEIENYFRKILLTDKRDREHLGYVLVSKKIGARDDREFAEPVFHVPLRAENCNGNRAVQGVP